MASKRGLGEDAVQDAMLRVWEKRHLSDNPRYKHKIITNVYNLLYKKDRQRVSTISYDAVDFEPRSLEHNDYYRIDASWAIPVLRDSTDAAIVIGIMRGLPLGAVGRTWGMKRWNSYLKPALAKAWKETQV